MPPPLLRGVELRRGKSGSIVEIYPLGRLPVAAGVVPVGYPEAVGFPPVS